MSDTITIELYGFPLVSCIPTSISVPYTEGLTVGTVVADLFSKCPDLKGLLPENKGNGPTTHIVTIVNGRDSGPNQRLSPGDRILVLSPPEGG